MFRFNKGGYIVDQQYFLEWRRYISLVEDNEMDVQYVVCDIVKAIDRDSVKHFFFTDPFF